MRGRRSSCLTGSAIDTPPIVRLWALRMLVHLGAQKDLLSDSGFNNESLPEALGMHHVGQDEMPERDAKQLRAELRRLHHAAEREDRQLAVPSQLARNIDRLSTLLPLSGLDQRLLGFAVMLHSDRVLETVADGLGYIATSVVYRALSVLLDATPNEVQMALSPRGALVKSGLIRFDRDGSSPLTSKLNLLSGEFSDQILHSESDPIELLRESVMVSAPPELVEDDFSHLRPILQVLKPYLNQALTTGRKGVNVLLHGVPGTGKSQLTRLLAQTLGCVLFEVTSEDADGDQVSGTRRMQAYRAAQSFLAHQRALILFDEIEDIFTEAGPMFGRMSGHKAGKAWLNRMLEENQVPALWLSNSISSMDAAFVRRFDVVSELPVPPRPQREQIIKQACGDFISAAGLGRLADLDTLAPAVVTRAAAVVRASEIELGERSASVELLISNTLRAQGHAPVSPARTEPSLDLYDPAFINADAPLDNLLEGLVRTHSARLCFYGPPGTGKTAFARWLAGQMGVSLIARKASDLLGMWLGETEKNVARAFRDAQEMGAVLLIDEVDAFLRDRTQARQSWEHNLVTEMLTQMESFGGILIASTNLMDGLDPAALRRFDLKVRFDYLLPAQMQALFLRYCEQLKLGTPGPSLLKRFASQGSLAPGDFAAVARRHRFQPFLGPEDLVFALEGERRLKGGTKAPIGFVH